MQDQNNDSVNSRNDQDGSNDELWKQAISSIVFTKPKTLPQSAWTEHIPFAFWLIDSLKPGVIVELGTHYGLSYFTFCQAIQKNQLKTKCYAIDNWTGDEHAGYYDNSVFEFVSKTNEAYKDFSMLYRSSFDDAVAFFKDKSIDLLHIDGLHTYEAVKHDFYNWLPKMSENGIVIFHDTNVMERDFGVYELWEELIKEYPFFDFKHGFGLGILGVGKKMPEKIAALFKIGLVPSINSIIRETYQRLGSLSLIEQEYNRVSTILNVEKKSSDYTENQSTKTEVLSNELPQLSATENDIPSETFLKPLQTICTQVYWKKEREDFNEVNSEIQIIHLANSKSDILFKLDQDYSSLKNLRIDPSTLQGIFYLHSISIAKASGEIILNWETIKKISIFYNLIIVKSSLLENAFVFIATTDDPIIEIELPPIHFSTITDSINLVIAVSSMDTGSLNKELSNITNAELQTEQIRSVNHLYSTFSENLELIKKEIRNYLFSSSERFIIDLKKTALIQQEKLQQHKDDLIVELRNQFTQFEKSIDEGCKKNQEKDEIINDLSKKLEDLKIHDAILKEHLLVLSEQVKAQVIELEKKKSILEINQKELLLKEQHINSLKDNIAIYQKEYENNSILGILKGRIFHAKKNI